MNKIFHPCHMKLHFILALGILYFIGSITSAQTSLPEATDSLDLDQVIEKVVSTHPTIQAAGEALSAADIRIALSRSYLLPDFDITASLLRQGPVPSLEFGGRNIQFMPDFAYNASFNARYTIYDFGRGAASSAVENENKIMAGLTIDQAKQKLALGSANVYFAILFLQEAIKIKKDQLKLLNEHLAFVEKKKATGSATEYEVLATKVNISNAESQEMDLEAAWKIQQSVLNTLLGDSSKNFHPVRYQLHIAKSAIPEDSLQTIAFQNRTEMKILGEKNIQAKLQYKFIEAQRLPVLGAFANAGAKNGYMPEINKFTPNYVIGLNLRIPLYDARQTRNKLALAKSAMRSLAFEESNTERSIQNELSESYNNLESASKKVEHNQLQLEQANQAYSLAEVNYKAGALTNLDLIDAQDKISQSRLMLLKSEIDYEYGLYKLKSALGEHLYR